jgi:hypothetical protein
MRSEARINKITESARRAESRRSSSSGRDQPREHLPGRADSPWCLGGGALALSRYVASPIGSPPGDIEAKILISRSVKERPLSHAGPELVGGPGWGQGRGGGAIAAATKETTTPGHRKWARAIRKSSSSSSSSSRLTTKGIDYGTLASTRTRVANWDNAARIMMRRAPGCRTPVEGVLAFPSRKADESSGTWR